LTTAFNSAVVSLLIAQEEKVEMTGIHLRHEVAHNKGLLAKRFRKEEQTSSGDGKEIKREK